MAGPTDSAAPVTSDAAPAVSSEPAVTSAPAEATPQPVTIVEPAKESLDDHLSRIYDEHNKPPEAKPAAAPKAAPPVASEPNSDQPTAGEPEPGQSSPAIAAPQSWSAEAKAEWGKLPPKAQDYIAQRESEVHKAVTQMGSALKAFEPLRPIYEYLGQTGVPQGRESEVITAWARAQHALDTNPVEALKWLAQSYNVDPAQLAGPGKSPEPPAGTPPASVVDDLFKDPRFDQLQPVIQGLQKKIDDQDKALRYFYGQQQTREHAETEQRQSYVNTVISDFSKGKPEFAELQDDIIREVKVLRDADPKLPMEKVLEQAYDRARWANPSFRTRILEEQRKTEADKAKQEAAKKQAEAKKHAAMNVRSGAAASTPVFDGKWDDDAKLSAIYDRAQTG